MLPDSTSTMPNSPSVCRRRSRSTVAEQPDKRGWRGGEGRSDLYCTIALQLPGVVEWGKEDAA
jgi:hypothetical protein